MTDEPLDAQEIIDDLSRRLERSEDERARLKEAVDSYCSSNADLIHANIDSLRNTYEEGLLRAKRSLEVGATIFAQLEIEAALSFHPMHAESWGGWPEQAASE